MATVETTSCIDQIGDTAGMIWHTLDEHGPMTITQLTKQVKASRDIVMQAIGWLAKEKKILLEESGRKRTISLC